MSGPAVPPGASDVEAVVPFGPFSRWVHEHDADLPGEGPITGVNQLQGGSQNVLVRVERAGGGFVVRRPPVHPRPQSAEVIAREVRVLRALVRTGVPHPEVYASCDDPSVIGVPFFCMQTVEGFTPLGPLPEAYDDTWRRAMALDLVDGAARLAAVDHEAVGLGDFGRAENWAARQVERWRRQLDGYSEHGYSPGRDLSGMQVWLDAHVPAVTRVGIIHGDLQWANTMFAHDRPALVAIIDWELSSLGDPLLDLGWILTSWMDPGDPPGHAEQLTPTAGLPTRAELVDRYCTATGRDPGDVVWFFVLACYKLGVILEGTYARSIAGKAPAAVGQLLHNYAEWLFAKADQLVRHPHI